MKVLIAEDSDTLRPIFVASLKKWDYEVVVAKNGAEAWQAFQQESIPIVLTDWTMPEMDGLELIRRIRGAVLSRYVYIILLTSHAEKEDLVAGMEAGADDYLAKPIDPRELRVRVRQGERVIRLEQTLANQNRQLRETQAALIESEKLAGLGQLAAGMAHEINNPVSFVMNNLAVLKRDVIGLLPLLEKYRQSRDLWASSLPKLSAEMAELEEKSDLPWLRESLPQLVSKSLDGLARVRQIVLNLQDFAHLEKAEFGDLDVNAALRSTVDILHHDMEARQLSATLSLAHLRPILCYPAKINQIFHCLLLNAVQASRVGGSIELRTNETEEGVLVEIEDHGSGIEAVDAPRVFEPFFTTRPVGSGRGLGLAITYGIVRDHGGVVHFDTVPGQGTTFAVHLPWQPPEKAAAATS